MHSLMLGPSCKFLNLLKIIEHPFCLLHEWNNRCGCSCENICCCAIKSKPTICARTLNRLNPCALLRRQIPSCDLLWRDLLAPVSRETFWLTPGNLNDESAAISVELKREQINVLLPTTAEMRK